MNGYDNSDGDDPGGGIGDGVDDVVGRVDDHDHDSDEDDGGGVCVCVLYIIFREIGRYSRE